MAVSDKLTYLNTTKGKIKDSINLTGANITSNDTFRSYATKLKNGLVGIINNGIDTLYDNFPKVTAEGTEIVLNNTYEAPIKLNVVKGDTQQDGTPTPDTPQEVKVVTGTQNVSVSDGTNTTNYEVDLGTLELCKINDYQDTLQKSSGKNLFDEVYPNLSSTLQYMPIYVGDGTFTMSSNTPDNVSGASIFLLAGNVSTGASTSTNGVYLNHSITQTSVNGYLTIAYRNYENINNYNTQLEENSTSTEYEPYGKVWYKKANIGKVVLDGSDIVGWSSTGTNVFASPVDYIKTSLNNNARYGFSNYYTFNPVITSVTGTINNGEFAIQVTQSPVNTGRLFFKNTNISTIYDFFTWLGTHNTTVYYVLATPTYETITNSTLINQLESIKSKEDSTNITISGDLPMIINASALEKE